jgi:hypothetical protein
VRKEKRVTDAKQPIHPSSHSEQRGIIESALRYIPGFRGYLEKNYRRESDYLARTWLADRLRDAKSALDSCMHGLVDQGRIDELPQFERLRTRLDGLISKMRGDVRGYSGFFDYVQIDEELLDQVYNHDVSLFDDVDRFTAAAEQLAASSSESVSATELLGQIDRIAQNYSRRGDLLKGLGQ